MLIISFDFGTKYIGMAIGENIIKKARALNTLKARNGNPDWNEIKKLIKYWKPMSLVVGLPLNIDGTKQNFTYQSEKFARLLKIKFNIPVNTHDERLTTVEAKSIAFKRGGFKELKKNIHSISAVLILESWLNKSDV